MTPHLSLHDRLARWFKANPGEHASGDIQRMVMEKTTYTAQNVGRRLRELENEGVLEVSYRKNHAHYRYKEQMTHRAVEVRVS